MILPLGVSHLSGSSWRLGREVLDCATPASGKGACRSRVLTAPAESGETLVRTRCATPGRRAGSRSCGVRLARGRVAHSSSGLHLRAGTGRRAARRGLSPGSRCGTPGPAPQLSPPRATRRPSFPQRESESLEGVRVPASRPPRGWDPSPAPATAGQLCTPAPGVPHWPAWPSRLTKGSRGAPNAGSPRLQRPPRRGPRATLRDPGLSAAAAARSRLLPFRQLGGAPC